MKAWQYILIIVVLAVFGYLIWNGNKKENTEPEVIPKEQELVFDAGNLTYEVEGEEFTLVEGEATIPVPDVPGVSNSLSLFGEPVMGDLDGDGDKDAAVWLMNDPGGTGKFYYAAFVMNDKGTARTVPAFFLGDRIAPQSLGIRGGEAIYSFADRKPDEPFTAEPTVGKSVTLSFDKKANKIIE